MTIQKLLIVVFLSITLTNCNKESANQVDTINTPNIEQKSVSIVESQEVLNEAINSLNNVAEEFHWRDTFLLIKDSQDAMSKSDFELSIELSQKVIQQSKLMLEQQEFAKNNWQNMVPIMDTK